MLVADWAGVHKLQSVFSQRYPPESLLYHLFGPLDPRVTGERGAVGPLEDVRSKGSGDEQAVRRTRTGPWLIHQSCLNPLPR